MNTLKCIFIGMFVLLGLNLTVCQNKVLGFPEKFERTGFPDTYEDYNNLMTLEWDKNKGKIWEVFSDREGVTFRAKPDANATALGELVYRDQVYYAVEEKNEWIRLGKPLNNKSGLSGGLNIDKSNFQLLGWVNKGDMLLWAYGMRDSRTGIHAKAFLLNKLDDFDKNELEKAYVYDSPTAEKPIGELPLYEFYYIYDVHFDEKNQVKSRYLLGSEVSFRGAKNIDKIIKGWVDVRRVTQWNTRMALEPNFNNEAFEERKNNKALQVKGFMKSRPALKFAQGKLKVREKDVLWDNDPVNADNVKGRLGVENSRRFVGTVQRFPCLNYTKSSTVNVFESGVIAGVNSIKDGIMTGIGADYQELANVNIHFVVEGSEKVGEYKEVLGDVIGSVNDLQVDDPSSNRVTKTGISVYRDFKESDPENRYDILSLSQSDESVQSFFNSIYWNDIDENDDWTALQHAVYKSVLRAGYVEKQTNVLVHIGSSGDFINHPSRRRKFEKSDESIRKEYAIDKDQFRNFVSKFDLNVIHVQVSDELGRVSGKFRDDVLDMMSSLTKEIYVKQQLKNIGCPVPTIPDIDADLEVEVQDFVTSYSYLRPKTNMSLQPSELSSFVNKEFKEIISNRDRKMSLINNIDKNGIATDYSSGDFTKTALPILRDVARRAGLEDKEDIVEFINSIGTDEKFYQKVYFVGSNYPTATYAPLSYVLLFPEEDLDDYISNLRILLDASYHGDRAERRESLKEYLINLAVQFTDEQITSKVDDISLKEIAEYMQGIQGEGYDVWNDGGLDFKIEDITNKNKFSDEKFDTFVSRLEDRYEKLDKIITQGRNGEYEFSYKDSGGKKYYWIPIVEVF